MKIRKVIIGIVSLSLVMGQFMPYSGIVSDIPVMEADAAQQMVNIKYEYGTMCFTLSDGKAELTEFIPDTYKVNTGSQVTITIPDMVDDCPVVSIGKEVFYSIKGVWEIIVPESVEYLGSKSLNSEYLRWVYIENPDIKLQDDLQAINFKTTVCGAKDSAAYKYALREGLKFSVEDQYVESNGFICKIEDGSACILGYKGEETEIVFPKEIEGFPVKRIDNATFHPAFHRGAWPTKIILPEGLEEIGCNCFYGCEELTEVELPDSLKRIESGAFENCISLEKIDIGENVEYIGGYALKNTLVEKNYTDKNGFTIINGCLINSINMDEDLVIPEGVKHIDIDFDYENNHIRSVVFPEGLKTIGNSAFCDCENLNSIDMPDTVEYIGEYAFRRSGIENVVLPDNLKTIGFSAFDGCYGLKSVTFPQNADIDIDTTAFAGTPFKASHTKDGMFIADDILIDTYGCTGDVIIPDGIRVICPEAFSETDITSVTIPDSVKIIGDCAFKLCGSLSEFTVPDCMAEITCYMFFDCYSLEKITLNDHITYIEDGAFSGCTGLKEITIPASVETVGQAFGNCDSLEMITIENPDCEIGEFDFNGFPIPRNTAIRGYKNSTAEKYAKEIRREFIPIISMGDANGDGSFNIADAVTLQKWLNSDPEGKISSTDVVDFNSDGKINAFDLVLMRQKLTKEKTQ